MTTAGIYEAHQLGSDLLYTPVLCGFYWFVFYIYWQSLY